MPPLLFLHPGDPQTGNVGFKKIPRIGLLGEVSKSRRQSLQNQAKTNKSYTGYSSGSAGFRVCFLVLFGGICWFDFLIFTSSWKCNVIFKGSVATWFCTGVMRQRRSIVIWTRQFTEIQNFLKHIAARTLEGLLKSKCNPNKSSNNSNTYGMHWSTETKKGTGILILPTRNGSLIEHIMIE